MSTIRHEFLDSLASNSFIPLILQPTRITSHSNTLIDNIFSNVIDPDIIPGNLTATNSDHLPQFAIIPNMFGFFFFLIGILVTRLPVTFGSN